VIVRDSVSWNPNSLNHLDVNMIWPTKQSLVPLADFDTKYGQQSIGTPEEMLSIVEPRPLCVRKPPIDGWLRTSSCGHQLQIKLLSLVSSVNSGGNFVVSNNYVNPIA
jgi:hypothetical protein